MKAAPFTRHTKDSDWENLAQCKMMGRLCALFKAHFWGTGLESYTRQAAKALLF
jgi:hypothetical protein